MKILHKYILLEWFRVFFIAVLATTGLLAIEDVYRNLHDFIQCGASVSRILHYYCWLLISICPTAIPVSFLLSLLFSLCKLHRNNELCSMRTAGLNIFQITRPLWFVGGFLSIVNLSLNMYLSPIASQRTQNFYADAKSKIIRRNLTFNNERDGRIWFIHEFNRQTSNGTAAMIYSYDGNGNETSRIFAKTFSYANGIWSFYDGIDTIFNRKTYHPVDVLKYDKFIRGYDESPELFLSLTKKPKYLSFTEIRKILSFSDNALSYRGYRIKFYGFFVSALSCLVIIFITIPFSTVGIRQNPISGVVKACATLFVFYLFSNALNILCANREFPIVLAISLPYCLAMLPARLLYRRCI